jgi:hypothetical protein
MRADVQSQSETDAQLYDRAANLQGYVWQAPLTHRIMLKLAIDFINLTPRFSQPILNLLELIVADNDLPDEAFFEFAIGLQTFKELFLSLTIRMGHVRLQCVVHIYLSLISRSNLKPLSWPTSYTPSPCKTQ